MTDGLRAARIYRRSVIIANERYAMLDDGKGFSLVSWRPVIKPGLGPYKVTRTGSMISASLSAEDICAKGEEENKR